METVQTEILLNTQMQQIVRFIVAPQLFNGDEVAAANALKEKVKEYKASCGKPYQAYVSDWHPFSAIVLHGF